MHEWFRQWLRTVAERDPPPEQQMELPFDPPLPRVTRKPTKTRSTQENI